MVPRRWLRWVCLASLGLVAPACESGDSTVPESTGGSAPQVEGCSVGVARACGAPLEGCDFAWQYCEEGSPSEYGACECSSILLTQVGPKYFTARSISGLAFGADAFYWAEYFFVQFAPYSRLLVSSPIGTPGEVLIEDIPGSVDFVSVQDDGIHVSGEKDWLYSLDGELLETLDPAAPEGEPEPEEEVGSGGAGGTGGAGGASASEEGGAGGAPKDETGSSGAPAEAPRITYSSDGLLLDGELVTEPVHAFSTTGSSVYYIESGDTGVIYRLFFDDPENPDAVADTDYAGAFDKVRVAGDLLGAVILNNDRVTWRVVYGDLSVLER